MRRIFITHSRMQRLQIPLALIVVTALAISSALVVSAAPQLDVIVLPGASSTEGIAVGRGATFFAGDLFRRSVLAQHG